MRIKINGEVNELENAPVTVTEILKVAKVASPDLVSVQLNGEFVERAAYGQTTVQEGDEIDFLYFLGGGAR